MKRTLAAAKHPGAPLLQSLHRTPLRSERGTASERTLFRAKTKGSDFGPLPLIDTRLNKADRFVSAAHASSVYLKRIWFMVIPG